MSLQVHSQGEEDVYLPSESQKRLLIYKSDRLKINKNPGSHSSVTNDNRVAWKLSSSALLHKNTGRIM